MSSIKTDEVDASSSLLASSEDDGVAVCYLCLDTGAHEPLRRDCSCRGTDAGFVHLSCLAEFAATKSKQASDMNEFRDPWRVCPGCHQCYQNELAIDIASKFDSFVRKQYPGDTGMQVEGLYLKLRALDNMLERLQPVKKIEAGVTANVMLSLIDRMKNDAPLSKRYSWYESYAYNAHGRIALEEKTKESARRSVTHFEKDLKVCEAIGDDDGIAAAKSNIAYAKSKYEGASNNEELLKASHKLYKLRVAEYGEEHEYTIIAGKSYAIHLREANCGDEAMELLMKLLATSNQVLGPDHNITKEVESTLQHANTQG